ncbi:MAG: preprotein translocase subunit SecE [Vulcanimicrobiaceae bacterium]|nr:preprotein translocase subunit SecE [Bacillota bacterium]
MNKAPGGAPTQRDAVKKKSALNRSGAVATRQAGRASAQDFVRGVILELKRVTWPTREEWISATVLTIVLVVGIGLFTFACDQLFGWLFTQLHTV